MVISTNYSYDSRVKWEVLVNTIPFIKLTIAVFICMETNIWFRLYEKIIKDMHALDL